MKKEFTFNKDIFVDDIINTFNYFHKGFKIKLETLMKDTFIDVNDLKKIIPETLKKNDTVNLYCIGKVFENEKVKFQVSTQYVIFPSNEVILYLETNL